MVEFKGMIITALLVGLFIFGLITFSSTLSDSANKNTTILQDERINRSVGNFQTKLLEAETEAEKSKDSFFKDIAVISQIGIILGSISAAGKIFSNVIYGLYDLTFVLIADVLGIPPVVMGVFTAIILITSILLIWRVYKAGSI